MRLLIDQNVPDSIAAYLKERGHDVWLVRDTLGRSSPDQLIAVTAELQHVIVVTFDKDLTRFRKLLPEGTRNAFVTGAATSGSPPESRKASSGSAKKSRRSRPTPSGQLGTAGASKSV